MALINQYSKEELENIVKNSYSYREVLIKLGYSCVNGANNNTLKKYLNKYNISVEHFTYYRRKNQYQLSFDEIFCKNSLASQKRLREAVIKYNILIYKCELCGNEGVWMDKPLSLNLDHINGHNHDNRIQNLRWLCPNCDRQQPTFGAKNLQKLEKNTMLIPFVGDSVEPIFSRMEIVVPDREIIKKKLYDYKNYTQCANYFGVSANQLRRWCRKYNLPTTISIVKHTSIDGWETENWNDAYTPPMPHSKQNKPCAMLDKNTEEILHIFSSRSEAARFLNLNQNCISHIRAVCNGLRKTAYGYKWKNIEDD